MKAPSYRLYWNSQSRYELIGDTMPRRRFGKLRSYLHFVDNTYALPKNHADHDKLFKIRPFLNSICNNFRKIAVEENSVVDEIMVPFKGMSSMKQYIKNKPHKWGIKIFAIASQCGIIHDFEIYVGKKTIPSKTSKLGISGDIVIRLADCVPKYQNYKLCFDNWFTSYSLIDHFR